MTQEEFDKKEGKQCTKCDVLFEHKHYYPVLCNDCYNEEEDEGITPELPRAKYVEL